MANNVKRAYLSGPISKISKGDARRLFDEGKKHANRLGYLPVSPMDYYSLFKVAQLSYDDIMDFDLLLLQKCDVVIFLPGWESSTGAKMEMSMALQRGMEIILPSKVNEL